MVFDEDDDEDLVALLPMPLFDETEEVNRTCPGAFGFNITFVLLWGNVLAGLSGSYDIWRRLKE